MVPSTPERKLVSDSSIYDFEQRLHEWYVDNSKILTWIHSFAEQQIGLQLSKFNVELDAWNYLKALYQKSNYAL